MERKDTIRSFAFEVKRCLGSFNVFYNATMLLFIKYIVDNPKLFKEKDPDFYEKIYEFADKIRRAENSLYVLRREDFSMILNPLDTFEEGTMFDNAFFAQMAYDLSDVLSARTSVLLLLALEKVDLKGMQRAEMIDMFEYLLECSSSDVNRTGSFTTNKVLRQIVSAILQVNDNDTLFNCFAGYSTLLLSVNNPGMYIAFDINKEAIAVSKIMTLMLGVKARILDLDFISQSIGTPFANKVFSNAPLGMKFRDLTNKDNRHLAKTKDPSIISIYNTLDSLVDGGIAVIAVTSRTLTSTGSSYYEMRREIAHSGLKAVIELPPLWVGASLQTNLLVIEKGYEGRVQFITTANLDGNVKGKRVQLNEDDVSRIIDSYKNELNIEHFSINVDRRDVICANSFAISNYLIPQPIESEHRDVEEIDSELDALYARLYHNLKK